MRNPQKLAQLADRRIKASPKALYHALHGRLTGHHRFMLQLHLGQYDALASSIEQIDRQVEAAIARIDEAAACGRPSFHCLAGLLCTIPGIANLAATSILSEIGSEMSRFATDGHLVSWVGLCPGQNESAGKRKSSRLRKGAPWLKTLLVQCAWAAVKKKDSYYKAQFNRLKSRRRPQESDLRGGRLDAHGDLSHPEKWRRTSGSRGRLFRSPPGRTESQALSRSTRQAWLQSRTTPISGGRLMAGQIKVVSARLHGRNAAV